MSSDIRDFTQFDKFGGRVVSGIYVFPVLYNRDSKDKLREWSTFVRKIKSNAVIEYGHNWERNLSDEVPITHEDLTLSDPIDPKYTVQVWSQTGQVDGKISKHPPTECKSVNHGRSNFRNAVQQGLILARKNYLKKMDAGYRPKRILKNDKLPLYFPMLAHKYEEKQKDIEYPCYAQPKLDGMRCMATWSTNSAKLYSRNRKPIVGVSYIQKDLKELLIQNPDIVLDGELYKHGQPLQYITSVARNSSSTCTDINYCVYDVIIKKDLAMSFKKRIVFLRKLLKKHNLTYTKPVLTLLLKTQEDSNQLYDYFINKGYEGMMMRNMLGKYKTSTTSKATRSADLQKRKELFTDEFEIVDFKVGKQGIDVGCIIWILKTKEGNKFNANPKGTKMSRKKLYKKLVEMSESELHEKYIGQPMTVEYRSLSVDKIPLMPFAIGIRNYE